MFRLFLALNFLLLNLLACKSGYELCRLKVAHSKAIKDKTLQIALPNNQKLIFSKYPPTAKIIKHNPFLNLYLIKESHGFKYPFKINNHLSLGVASVDEKIAIEGKIIKRQIGLNRFATFSDSFHKQALLLDSCCALEGIVTPEGIIEKEYIERFLNSKESIYGDIGIRVDDERGALVVYAVNRFLKDNPFKINDSILEFNCKKVQTATTLMREILFSKVGSTYKVKLKRGRKLLTFNIKSHKRYGGGYLSDTFLEFLGIFFDENLYIVKIEKKAQKYALKLGDRLIQIDFEDITNEEDIIKIVSQSKNSTHLLFERAEFQFFIRLN